MSKQPNVDLPNVTTENPVACVRACGPVCVRAVCVCAFVRACVRSSGHECMSA